MKQVWIWGLALFFITVNGYALQTRKITASVGAPVPTSYSSSDTQSIVFQERLASHANLQIHNGSATEIACAVKTGNTTSAPSSPASEEIPIPATTVYQFQDLTSSDRVYCRSTGSAITSGTIIVVRW